MVPVPTTAVLFQAVGRRTGAPAMVSNPRGWLPARDRAAYIAGFGSALPGGRSSRSTSGKDASPGTSQGDRVAERVFLGAGVRRRHAAIDPLVEDISGWSTARPDAPLRVRGAPAGQGSRAGALADAGVAADDVGMFAVVSCTGYATPGIDIRIAADLGMAPDVQRLLVGHMGCYAAIPGLGAVADYVVSRGRPAVLLCLELTSLHVQPPTDDRGQLVAHALFGDAAAAVVLRPGDAAAPGRVGWRCSTSPR